MRKLLISILCVFASCFILTGCTEKTDGDEKTIQEIQELTDQWVKANTEQDYETMKSMLGADLQKKFAPIVMFTTFTSQFPESKSCKQNALNLAKYLMSRLYLEPEVEKISVSQDKSEARVLMKWRAVDTDKADLSNVSEIVNNVSESQYLKRKDEYDANTEQFGEESTELMLHEDSFDEVFAKIHKLYEDVPDKEMHGVLSFSYTTGEGYKLTAITQYMDLLYREDGTYNWEYESAQNTFDKDKELIENSEGATK